MLFKLTIAFLTRETSIDLQHIFTAFMCKKFTKGFCILSGKNCHDSFFINHMANCDGMITFYNKSHLYFNFQGQ